MSQADHLGLWTELHHNCLGNQTATRVHSRPVFRTKQIQKVCIPATWRRNRTVKEDKSHTGISTWRRYPFIGINAQENLEIC